MRSSMQIIHHEAVTMGLDDKAESASECYTATDKISAIVLSTVWEYSAIEEYVS